MLLVLASGVLACGRPPQDATVTTRIGWVTSGCLAISGDSIADGTPVTVVALGTDDTATVVEARVTGRGSTERKCPVRAAAASGDGSLRFYTLSNPLDVGIAVVGPVARKNGGIDVNGDDRADQFTRCTASEGISFAVWTNGRPHTGAPFWSGYEYLGYDVEPDCPEQ
jgi:hypothetical protein